MKEKRNFIDVPSLWLALAVVLFTTMQPFLCSITMLGTGQTLSEFVKGLYGIVGISVSALILVIYLGYGKRAQGFGFRVERALPLLTAVLWLTVGFTLWQTVWYFMAGMAPMTIVDNLSLIQILSIIWIVLGILGAAILLHWMIHISWRANQKIGFGSALKCLLKQPLTLLLAFLITALLPISNIVTGTLGRWIGFGFGASYLSMMGTHLLDAIAYYWILKLLFTILRKGELKTSQRKMEREVLQPEISQQKQDEKEDKGILIRRLISCGVAAVLAVAALLYQNFDGLFLGKDTRIFYNVEVVMDQAEIRLLEGNFDAVLQEVQTASTQLQALDSYVNEETVYDIAQLYRDNTKDPMIGSIYLVKTGDSSGIEQKIRTGQLGSEWYPVLLDYYDTLEELTEEQKALRSEMLQVCIANEVFVSDMVLASEVESKKLAVRQNMELYNTYLEMYTGLDLVTSYGKNGGVTRDLVYRALDLAETNPENLSLQYMGCVIASSYQSDEADHYGRTMDTLARFDSLYSKNLTDSSTKAQEKNLLGEMALKCYQYDIARNYFDTAYELDPKTSYALQSAYCSERLGDYETCLTAAEKAIAEDGTNDQALYLQCMSALKLGDVDTALDAAGGLADLIENGKAADQAAVEQELYICAQFLSMRDDDYWTDYTYCVYDKLSEEQVENAQAYPMLWNYMTAIYNCFMSRDYTAAMTAVDEILAINEKLTYAWYMKGTIYGNQRMHEEALAAYLKAEEMSNDIPAVLFSIANTYDALGEYEKAYQYCQRIAGLMPDVDHGGDLYGVIHHNKKLMAALEKELGIGG